MQSIGRGMLWDDAAALQIVLQHYNRELDRRNAGSISRAALVRVPFPNLYSP
jgi:hypothetical protein